MSSIFMSIGAGVTWISRALMEDANRSFLVCAAFSAIAAAVMFWRLHTMTRRAREAEAADAEDEGADNV